MYSESHPIIICEFSCADPEATEHWDANGSLIHNSDKYPADYAVKILRELKSEKKILDYGVRACNILGFTIRILVPAQHIDCIDRFTFVMCLRWDKFRETQRREIQISETFLLTTDWKQINSLY